ncbi:MAG: LLM class flavin-dependent oxidoreductase [Nostocoides sp.]
MSQSTESTPLRLSLLDLAMVGHGQDTGEALRESLALAKVADRTGGFERLWFAEHHNMPSIASAATSVLIGQVLAVTDRLRVGAGGVMLPNHSPLVIAEQFGTLAELYPGRVDLGLGRAPGTDQATLRALRRRPEDAENFPADIRELQAYLGPDGAGGIHATPGRGTNVPLWVLGSSMFGATLAAAYGLPYAFASHFAPDALLPALSAYREKFQPSAQCERPYAIAALNVIAADSPAEADARADRVLRGRVRSLASRMPQFAGDLNHATIDALLASPLGAQARHMVSATAVGTAEQVEEYLRDFRDRTGADELMVTNPGPGFAERRRTLEILATLT